MPALAAQAERLLPDERHNDRGSKHHCRAIRSVGERVQATCSGRKTGSQADGLADGVGDGGVLHAPVVGVWEDHNRGHADGQDHHRLSGQAGPLDGSGFRYESAQPAQFEPHPRTQGHRLGRTETHGSPAPLGADQAGARELRRTGDSRVDSGIARAGCHRGGLEKMVGRRQEGDEGRRALPVAGQENRADRLPRRGVVPRGQADEQHP